MTVTPVFHCTREDEVSLTECGLFLPYLPEGKMWGEDEVVALPGANFTGWPSRETPRGMTHCSDCTRAYNEGATA